MLFADADDVTAGASVVACALAAITGLFSWLAQRDKLRYDVQMAELKAEVKHLQEQTAECHEEHAQAKQERDALTTEVRDLRRKVDPSGPHSPLW